MNSKSAVRHAIYDTIHKVAIPGDVCFFISEDPDCYQKISKYEQWYRRWMGFQKNDLTIWHIGLLSKFEKKPKSSQIRPYIIHSTKEKGVFEQHIRPEYFTSENVGPLKTSCRTILEILRFEGLSSEQNNSLVKFCRDQIGKPFPPQIRSESLTYLFGLPNWFNSDQSSSCHSLIFSAFSSIGIKFPHHFNNVPWFNLARIRGYPFGHSSYSVNDKYPYLRDHHLYQDQRFKSILTLTYDCCDCEIKSNHNPDKFSWAANKTAHIL